jgi:hypothetical protein
VLQGKIASATPFEEPWISHQNLIAFSHRFAITWDAKDAIL